MAWNFYYFTHILKDDSWKLINVTINYGNATIDYGNLQKLVQYKNDGENLPRLRDFTDWNLKYEPWNLSESWNMGPHLSIFEIS